MRRTTAIAAIFALCIAALVFHVTRRTRALQAAQPEITFYWGENFTGRSVTLTGTAFDLPVLDENGEKINWNDEIRSVVVTSGTWRLYQHGRCNTELDKTPLSQFDVRAKAPAGGWSCLLSATSRGPLEIPDPAAGGFWRDISSVELVSSENLPDWAMDFRK